MPRLRCSTLFWTATTSICVTIPKPRPKTAIAITVVNREGWPATTASSASAAVISPRPASGKRFQRPVRAILRPASVVETVIASIIGTSSSPARVGLAPVVVWRNSGTKTVIANSDAVARNSATLAPATVGVRSISNGTIGSPARRSGEYDGYGDQAGYLRRAPRVPFTAPDAHQDERAGRPCQEQRAERVE